MTQPPGVRDGIGARRVGAKSARLAGIEVPKRNSR
jgi:hypothetical protein